MSEKTMSITAAARNFSKVIRHAERNESTLLLKKGKPVARIVPVGSGAKTTHSFAKAWPRLRQLSPTEAEDFARDIETARANLPPLLSPWDKY